MALISSLLTLAAAGCGERFAQGSSDGGGGGSGGKDATASSAASGGSGAGGATTSSTSSSPTSSGTGGEECVVIGPEVCNGVDDDCNLGVDNGCPNDVVLSGGTFEGYSTFNAPVMNNFQEVCPPGHAIFQISGLYDESFMPPAINTIQAACAEVVLEEDTSNIPFTYRVTRGNTMTLPAHGGMTGTPFTLTCPGERFAIGLSGIADEDPNLGVQQSRLHCATLEITGTPGDFSLQYGNVHIEGGSINTTYDDFVEEPLLMGRYRGRAEMWLQSIGIGEVTPTIVLK